MQNALQLLKQADRYKQHEEPVTIPLDGEAVLEAKLISPDLFELQEELEDLKKAAYLECKDKGWDKLPPDLEEWEDEIEGYKKSDAFKELNAKEKATKLKELQESKPKNLAEQRAPYKARLRIVRFILPRLLRNPETGERMFKTDAEIREVTELIGAHPELMSLLSRAYSRLADKNKAQEDEVRDLKND